ncbi:M23 family metallopeptidase [Mechercharimyces sp. CAU 1602]|uniref:M23 family metallopeptidase n=1 Tax=Mechercharimyces sp. CAU 1602 TaxID=2973933 RepID=UPI002161E931|nr:M23 family metallopeptidase [Mechercharimyces sp. CAU 1602]MCS1352133.1 M23 family metallopeptidase [Mechercharimyces sp. CAU 1602]
MRGWSRLLVLLLILGGSIWYVLWEKAWIDPRTPFLDAQEVRELELPGKLAPLYVEIAKEKKVPWAYLAAWDEVTSTYEGVKRKEVEQRAQLLANKEKVLGSDEKAFAMWLEEELSPAEADKARVIAKSYQWQAASLAEENAFPFMKQDESAVEYSDSWGAARTYGGERQHEGTDMFAKPKTPIVAVTAGTIVRKGWNELGGWSLTLRDSKHPQIYYYYAHMNHYADGIEEGDRIEKEDVIGYVGDSGYGPEGTTGQFPSHLHFGIYVQEGKVPWNREAVNPYPFLQVWKNE